MALLDARETYDTLVALGEDTSIRKQQWKTDHYRDVVQLYHPNRTNRDGVSAITNIPARECQEAIDSRGFTFEPKVGPPLADDASAPGLADMNVKALRDLANELEIPAEQVAGAKKADLIAAIEAKQAELANASGGTGNGD